MTGTPRPLYPPLWECAIETEKYVAAAGWDQPVRLFALVRTAALIHAEPHLASQLAAPEDPDALSAIEQEDVPVVDPLEDLLGSLAWPAEVDGVALAVERIVVPPQAQEGLPDDPAAAARILADHPDRVDVRLLVAVTRDGESTCLLRQRPYDSDDQVAAGQDIAPDLVAALAATLQD
nr:PPA1309 family protein [Austwickia sp. TVS 96-490-7B]